jgi:outer membrane protein assembly factor BamB
MRHLRMFVLIASSCLLAGAAAAADWPQFRGPNQNGISPEPGALKSWPADGPKVLWKVPLGDGYSQVVVSNGRLFTLAGQGNQDYAVALDAATGRQLWRVPIDKKFFNDQGDGSRSTPTVDGDTVYVLSAQGKLAALRTSNGEAIWKHDLRQAFGAQPPTWGISTSPVVEGNLLLVNVGGTGGKSIVAFDKKTGKTVWASQNDPAGYSTPVAITVRGVRQVIVFTGQAVVALSPTDGKLLWRIPWKTDWDVNAAIPLFFPPDKLFVSSGYDTGSALFQIKVAGGKVTPEQVWRSREMKNQFSSSLLHDGILYGFDNATLKAMDAATGQERWRERGFGHGSLILAGGHLIILSDRGKLALVQATPQEYRELGSAQMLSGKCWTAPTVAMGKLFLRNQEQLVAVDWTSPKAAPAAKTGR